MLLAISGAYEPLKATKEHETYTTICRVHAFIIQIPLAITFHIRKIKSHYLKLYIHGLQMNNDIELL